MTSQHLHIIHALRASAMALAFGVSAQAAATRTFVSTIGNDANTSVDCSPAAPCRTFTAALSVTNAGGELVVLTSGGYGPANISQPVVITAIGVDASISVPAGVGLNISTTGNVTLIGLSLHGEATGLNGIQVLQVGYLRLYNILAEGFTDDGVIFDTSGSLEVDGSRFNDNGNVGIYVVSGSASMQGSTFDHNLIGVAVDAGHTTVADSGAFFNSTGFLTDGGILTLSNDRVASNNIGLGATLGGTLYFANCNISGNTTAYTVVSGSTMAGTNPGTSFIAPGQAKAGTLSTAVALE